MSYRHLLRGNGPAVLTLGLLARLPYAMTPLGTLMLLRSATGSYGFAGLAAGAQSLAIGAGGLLAGRLAERLGLRHFGGVAAILNAAAITGLLVAARASQPAMVTAAVLVGLTQPQVGPLLRVHWSYRATTRPWLLSAALPYEAAADEVSFIVGPAAVGLLTGLATPAAPLAASAALLIAAGVPLAALYARRPVVHQDGPAARVPIPMVGLAVMVAAMTLMGGIFGALQAGVTAYAQRAASPGAAGWLYAELGLGSALAGLACVWIPRRHSLSARYRGFSVCLVVGMTGMLLLPLPVAFTVGGFTVAPYMISIYAITERLAPPRVTTTMTAVCAGGPVGTAAGQALGGMLVDTRGYHAAVALALALAGLAAVLALTTTRLWNRRPEGCVETA
jgi:predicted MFS family arabinose efflux permease